MKRPSFQFYPADWRKDPALSACSMAARGMWIELMCIAHESDNYGYLSINGKPMVAAQIARMVGEPLGRVVKLLGELDEAGVFSRDDKGCIYSRRMVKDEKIRNVRADAGRLGGNPNLLKQKDKQKNQHLVKQTAEQKLTPSSSSSSSSSEGLKKGNSEIPKDWMPDAEGVQAAAGFDLNAEVQTFRNNHISKGSVMADWQAAWKSWIATRRLLVKAALGSVPAQMSNVWHESAPGVDRMAAELGLAPIDEDRFESRPAFKKRVLHAAAMAGCDCGTPG